MNSKLSTGEQASAGQAPSTEQKYRELLWLSHGHDGLYGDDGEMQCGLCKYPDYKRDPLDKVEECYNAARMEVVAKAMAAEVQSPEAPRLCDELCSHGVLPEWCDQCTVQEKYARSQHIWKEVVKSPLFQFLKHHPDGRTILRLFQQEQISLGKCAEAIVETHELGLRPKLPLESSGDESPAPATPKVLTGADIERLATGNHACKPDTCGCYCGITYNKNWEWIIASHDGTHTRPRCKCIPAERAAASPEPAEQERGEFENWLRVQGLSTKRLGESYVSNCADAAWRSRGMWLAASRLRLERLEGALREYVKKGHHDTCSYSLSTEFACDCGYIEAIAALELK